MYASSLCVGHREVKRVSSWLQKNLTLIWRYERRLVVSYGHSQLRVVGTMRQGASVDRSDTVVTRQFLA